MYPASVGNQWLTNNKPESAEEKQDAGNAARSWQWRERGLDPPNYSTNKRVLENLAEDILVRKPLEVRVSFTTMTCILCMLLISLAVFIFKRCF